MGVSWISLHVVALSTLFSHLTAAISIDCSKIVVDGKKFNFESLDGDHSLYTIDNSHPNKLINTTFTLDICRPLKKTKGVPKGEDCPNGSRVCAIQRVTNTVEDSTMIDATIPIAGEYLHSDGGALDPKWTRFKTSPSTSDQEKEGLRLVMNGGSYEKEDQRAVIEFTCPKTDDKKSDGEERRGAADVSKSDDDTDKDEDKDEDKTGETAEDGHGGTLKFVQWKEEESVKVLRLSWKTKFACEDSKDEPAANDSGHWGFFTWFIVIVFMGIAAYLIFGSWLNYNRLGTRGFDSVPHADTLRDLPYLFKDWMRRVVDTFQGGHSRAGYSAV